MGSIVSITTHKEKWNLTGKEAKIKTTGEEIIEVVIGEADYDYDGWCDITIWIRKTVYDKVMSGAYSIDKDSHWRRQLYILDENGKNIEPFKENFIY